MKKEEPFYECLVFPAPHNQDTLGLILPSDVGFATHRIEVNGSETNARIMVKVRESTEPVDPFEFSYGKNVEKIPYGISAGFEPKSFDSFPLF